jgi:hypothetical protein
MSTRALVVAVHDVEPRTLERCRAIRQWLAERGVDRVTLLAVPDMDGQPLEPGGSCAWWLRSRLSEGDAVAQHGLRHRRRWHGGPVRDWLADRQGGEAAEFVGMSERETAQAVDFGRALLLNAGVRPRGFVAPAYAYTRALRRTLESRFAWYGGLLAIHGARPRRSAALGLGTSTAFKRQTSPAVLRVGAQLPTPIVRIDVHPEDFGLPRHVAALDAALRRHRRRRPMTYDELVG